MQARASSSDYTEMIREEYFPFWDEETRAVWEKGVALFTELCGTPPDADFTDHELLCLLLVERELALRRVVEGDGQELFRNLDEGLLRRTLTWGYDYFIATRRVVQEILITMASLRCRGGTA